MKNMKNLYKLLIIRLLINLADSLFYVVTIWRVANNFNSTIASGLIVAAFTVPEMLQIFIGPLVDRYEPRAILLIASAIQIVVLAIVVVTWNSKNIFLVLLLVLLSTLASASTYPIEDILIPQIVSKDKIVFANSLFSISYQAVDSLFNAISGLLLTIFTTFFLYKLNLFLFALVFIPLYFFRYHAHPESQNDQFSLTSYSKDLKEGYKVIVNSRLLLEMSLPLTFINFFNSVNAVALPYYCKTFAKPTIIFGIISTAASIGGILGSLIINYFVKRFPVGKLVTYLLILNGALWIAGIVVHDVILTSVLLFISYLTSGMYNVAYSSLYQTLPPAKVLGRVNTTIDSLITIAMPIGGVLGGILLDTMPAPVLLALFGTCVILSGVFYITRPQFYQLPYMDKVERQKL